MSRVTNQTYARRVQRERVDADRRADIAKHVQGQMIHGANMTSDNRTEHLRRQRQRQQRSDEQRTIDAIDRQAQAETDSVINAQEEEALAQVLRQRKIQSQRKEAYNRRVCDESEELKELEAKLKAAYMNQQRVTQLEEKRLNSMREFQQDRAVDAQIEQSRQYADQRNLEDQHARKLQSMQNRVLLQNQIEARELQRQKQLEEYLKEKEHIDAIVAKINQEDFETEKVRLQKQAETRTYIETYLQERESWKKAQAVHERKELDQIQEWIEEQDRRLEDGRRRKAMQREKDDAAHAEVTRAIEADRAKKDAQEQLLIELFIEEAEQKIVQEEARRARRAEDLKLEMIEENRRQQVLKAQHVKAEREEEERLRKQMLDKFADDDRIEQMNAQKRRMKTFQHQKDVEKILEQRREMYELELERERLEQQEQQHEEAQKREIVEQERLRLLQEYATKLRDYLPKGVLKTQADLDLVFGDRR